MKLFPTKNMASSSFTLCSLLLLTIVFGEATEKKVKLSIFYGSMDPQSAEFLNKHFPQLFSTDIIDIVDLHLVPSEGTFVYNQTKITCQNGEKECHLSMLELCAMNILIDPRKYGPLISCLEGIVLKGAYTDVNYCINGRLKIKIDSCIASGLGAKLLINMKRDDRIYAPPPNFKPWVLVNERALRASAFSFIQYICDAYRGPIPKACHQ